mgnify:CR=1 FL=1
MGEGGGYEVVGTAGRDSFFSPDLQADVLIDFSHPDLTVKCLEYASEAGLPVVIGTTGLDDRCHSLIEEVSGKVPVCVAANFSIGVTVMMSLVAQAASALPEEFDIEISEAHHRRKLDAPSGTALVLGDMVADARGRTLADSAIFDRSDRRQARSPGEIGFQVTRGGDVVGEHTVKFLGEGERLSITHAATDRTIFARGALLAAEKLYGRGAGRVEFAQLLLA